MMLLEYADDVNFLDEEKVRLESVLPIATHKSGTLMSMLVKQSLTTFTRL